ncbi:MAG: helix-turn-helix transcriptional regulator [Alphaproteobacteria bacterium]|nr:helix-turn-helix transcriptional regulator [Alphaproteobacteria bacterium]
MATPLQMRLKHLMQEKNLRTSDLEKLAGLKMSAVRNIMLGKTKHPKAETLQAIAEVLGCAIADLLGKESTKEEGNLSPKVERPQLLVDAAKTLVSLLETNDCNLTLDQACLIIKETYAYSTQNESDGIDEQFAKWFFSKQKCS